LPQKLFPFSLEGGDTPTINKNLEKARKKQKKQWKTPPNKKTIFLDSLERGGG
jgi:hypothetical protein